jgi:hypothetical protein
MKCSLPLPLQYAVNYDNGRRMSKLTIIVPNIDYGKRKYLYPWY